MEISAEKTKLMTNIANDIHRETKVKGQTLGTVTTFKYFGAIIQMKDENRRIAQATVELTKLKPIWRDNDIFYSILFYPITLGGRRGTTDEFATIPFHLDLFSAALVELAKSIPVHSLILSSHLFFCLPLFLFPFTVPCRIVFAKPEDLQTWPNHLSFRFLTRVRSSSYSPMAAWIFLRTSSLVTWSLYEMFNSLR